MISAKDKAKELFGKYYSKPLRYWSSVRNFKTFSMGKNEARECAIIAVDEIIDAFKEYTIEPMIFDLEFWQEVRKEIELL